jgi:hypothetical protein
MSRVIVALLAIGLCACSSVTATFDSQSAGHEDMVQSREGANIFVTSADIPAGKRYKVLGILRYSEAFSADSLDQHRMKEKLKAMASERYHDDVDAVIKAHSDANDSGTTITVTAEAIKFETLLDGPTERGLCLDDSGMGWNCDAL